jgi:two-component system, chemotaxis family, chemotaxis protein CheY
MGKKILFADDDPIARRNYQQPIELLGYELVEASNGRDALEAAKREKPLLAVIDIEIPDGDALSLLCELKKSPATRSMPVIVITPREAFYSCREELKAAGAACFLTKPFGPAQLLAAIGACLNLVQI